MISSQILMAAEGCDWCAYREAVNRVEAGRVKIV